MEIEFSERNNIQIEKREDIEENIFFFYSVKFVDKKSKILYNNSSEKMYILNTNEGGKE